MDEPEPEEVDKSHTALHDSSSVRMEWVEGERERGYSREDAYRVLAGLPPRGTVNVPLVELEQSPEEVDRLYAGLHGPRREQPEQEPDRTDRDDEA